MLVCIHIFLINGIIDIFIITDIIVLIFFVIDVFLMYIFTLFMYIFTLFTVLYSTVQYRLGLRMLLHPQPQSILYCRVLYCRVLWGGYPERDRVVAVVVVAQSCLRGFRYVDVYVLSKYINKTNV